jgi:hypothetical protein
MEDYEREEFERRKRNMRVDKPVHQDENEDDTVDDLTAGDIPEEGEEETKTDEELVGEEETDEDTNDTNDEITHAGAANLTLTAIAGLTGISYVTLCRYAREHQDRLPFEGKGKARRYYPAAVEVFRAIKAEAGDRRGEGGKTAQAAGEGDRPAKAPRRPRRPRKPAERTSATASSPAKRRGRPRKNPDEAPAVRRGVRGRPPRSRVVADPSMPQSEVGHTSPISHTTYSNAETAFRRAHLTSKLESVQGTIDYLMGERESLKAEIDRLT